MLRKKLAESLNARIFLATALILLFAGGVTFGCIAWATPRTYTAVIADDLARQMELLADQLEVTRLEDCGPVLDEFIRSSGADIILSDSGGTPVDTGSLLAARPLQMTGDTLTYTAGPHGTDSAVTVTASRSEAVARQVHFAGGTDDFTLTAVPRIREEHPAVQALLRTAPWLAAVLFLFSLLCAFVYSRCISRPIVRLSRIAEQMEKLDFGWECGEARRDEIGALGRSLDRMARRLSETLEELTSANEALQGEMERERERERQRTAFFSAASHELKTPVTILKGQLSGMIDGVDVYRDRDKYLLRSLAVTERMEHLIQEMLSISRMESGKESVRMESVDLSGLLARQLDGYRELLEQRRQTPAVSLAPGITVTGDAALLKKAVRNLLSNASLHSPEGARIRVWCGRLGEAPAFSVENTGAHIREEALAHLFEAFYREESSRSRSMGGSGLGLYLAQIIFKRHGARCMIENTDDGVKATVLFECQPPV